MGVFKKFVQADALTIDVAFQWTSSMSTSAVVSTRPFKTRTGLSSAQMSLSGYNNMPFCSMTGYITSDKLSEYDYYDYEAEDICSVTKSQTIGSLIATGYVKNFIFVANNNTGDSITVSCVKFTKYPSCKISSSTSAQECLFYAYYLDTPVEIPAGATKTITITLSANDLN